MSESDKGVWKNTWICKVYPPRLCAFSRVYWGNQGQNLQKSRRKCLDIEAGEKIFIKKQKKWAKARTGTQVCFADRRWKSRGQGHGKCIRFAKYSPYIRWGKGPLLIEFSLFYGGNYEPNVQKVLYRHIRHL